jgi:hypothetical protein
VVGSGSSDRGRESPYRSFQTAFRESVNRETADHIAIPHPAQILQATPTLAHCPDCTAPLAVLRVIPGRAGAEYWTMRCTDCGGIHLDIVKPASTPLTA